MRACERCEKSYKKGGTRKLLRGHYNQTTAGKKKANLQFSNLYDGKKRLLCTKCIRTLSKTK